MYEELYETLSRKGLIRYFPCSREEYFSKSYCDEQSNVYYRYIEIDQLIVIACN